MNDERNSMEIQLETPEPHAIKSYTDSEITIQGISYRTSSIVSKETIQSDWPVHSISDLSELTLTPLLITHPEIIIIGHSEKKFISPQIISMLSQKRIGIECMSIGSACRTFNVLLGERRIVKLGIIMP